MSVDWSPLTKELSIWRRDRRQLQVWWRDDDAVVQTAALDRLLDLSESCETPLALAVVPQGADQSLVDACENRRDVSILVHGWAHRNNAISPSKKCEFPEGWANAPAQARAGIERLRSLFGATLVPVFVPPWNRISDDLLPLLGPMGYSALSTFTPRRSAFAAPGLGQINTHVDPINWRAGGGLAPQEQLITHITQNLRDRRVGQADASEPLGLLTHHLVHTEEIWEFSQRCIMTLREGGAEPFSMRELAG